MTIENNMNPISRSRLNRRRAGDTSPPPHNLMSISYPPVIYGSHLRHFRRHQDRTRNSDRTDRVNFLSGSVNGGIGDEVEFDDAAYYATSEVPYTHTLMNLMHLRNRQNVNLRDRRPASFSHGDGTTGNAGDVDMRQSASVPLSRYFGIPVSRDLVNHIPVSRSRNDAEQGQDEQETEPEEPEEPDGNGEEEENRIVDTQYVRNDETDGGMYIISPAQIRTLHHSNHPSEHNLLNESESEHENENEMIEIAMNESLVRSQERVKRRTPIGDEPVVRLLSLRQFKSERDIERDRERDGSGSGGRCMICLNDFIMNKPTQDEKERESEIALTECGHLFHAKCMHLLVRYQRECPICRGFVRMP